MFCGEFGGVLVDDVVERSDELEDAKDLAAMETPRFWYSPTRRSKKFVLPSSEINSIHSKGFAV